MIELGEPQKPTDQTSMGPVHMQHPLEGRVVRSNNKPGPVKIRPQEKKGLHDGETLSLRHAIVVLSQL